MVETQARPALTGSDLLTLPRGMGERYELIDGELVAMTPAGSQHGAIVGRITVIIGNHVLPRKLGVLFGAETGFYTRADDKTVRAPDVAFLARSRLPAESLPAGFLNIPPDLVVEVVSPGDRAGEIEQKTQEWLNFGVAVVWVVYPETQHVYVYSGQYDQPRILKARDTITGREVLPGFEVLVSSLFQD